MFSPVEKDWTTLREALVTKPTRMKATLVWRMLGKKISKKIKGPGKSKTWRLEQS